MLIRSGLAGVVVAGLAAFAAGALAEPPSESLHKALEASAAKDGGQLVGEAQYGDLDDADEATIIFEVDASKTYKLYSVCDEDCTELSVSARDSQGGFIDNSSGQDSDTPVLEIEDFKGATISVKVFMMDCSVEPCAFALSLAEHPDTARTAARIGALAKLLVGGSTSTTSATVPEATEAELIDRLKARVFDSWVPVGDIETGKLGTGEAKRYFFDVEPGSLYYGFAGCDCSNLDLVARDDDDKTLTSDLASDNRPIVEVTSDSWPEARRSGRQKLVIEVKMTRCDRQTCGFAAGLYRAN